MRKAGVWMACVCVLFAGCQEELANQPRAEPLEPAMFFADGRASRHLVPGTVARGFNKYAEYDFDDEWESGRAASGELIPNLPPRLTENGDVRQLLERGQQRFRIFCAPCHGLLGDGDGMVVRRGYPPPPTYHNERLRAVPVSHFFVVATDGFGRMPDYGRQVSTDDRWAIAAYVRALQLSQHVSVDRLSDGDRRSLESRPQPEGAP